VTTPAGVVFFTGDYKFDYTPVEGGVTDVSRLARIGDRGVLLMLGESTNVEREGSTVSEKAVGENFDKLFAEAEGRRIIVATFASNINRVQQIVNTAQKYHRKVAFGGRSMVKIAEIGKELGYLRYDPNQIVDIDKIKRIADGDLVIISTGSQGEQMSALTRMANGEFPGFKVGANDTVIISASPIPGNERSVYSVINNLCRLGAKVVYHTLKDLHVSGHAHKEELKLMLSLIRPRFFIPVHGEYRHLSLHADLAMEMGIKKRAIIIPEIGSLVNVNGRGIKVVGTVPAGNTYIDGDASGEDDMELLIKDRKQLAADGMIIVFMVVKIADGQLLTGPEVMLRGVAYPDDLVNDIKHEVAALMAKERYTDTDRRGALKAKIGKTVRNQARRSLHSVPMVLPIIVEI
jgi:ribonuclease J